ncbi:MAG: succinylglutamate desuccinylase/aspartoacylase family protein [Pirellulaceae bacterium]|jgi:predicted deacylase
MTSDSVRLARSEFVSKDPGARVLITGGVHGDEFEPMQAIRELIARFEQDSLQLLRGSLILVPVVNEMAFLRGHRAADDGKDLARTCPGRDDGSVTERTAAALSQLIEESDYYIDLHTGGTEFSVFPLAGYTLHPDQNVLDKQRAMAIAFNLPIVWGTAGNLDGRSLSVARDANVPAIYTEYLGGARCSDDGIAAYVEGCVNVLMHLYMLKGESPASRVSAIVEDSRTGSGHMQVCHPSPITGYFHPQVSLGDSIEAGQSLGWVSSILGDNVIDVPADRDGIVLVLRTFPRVRKGESVGVVLDGADEYQKEIK